MEFVNLGRTGVNVSRLCMGTAFREVADERVCKASIERAVELGINFIDTSNVYPDGKYGVSEAILGSILADKRDQLVVTTKIFNPTGPHANDRGLSRVHLMREIDRSLGRLRTDYVDVLFLHEPDPRTPLEESLRALDAIIKAGKARYVGLSRFHAWQAVEAQWIADRHHLEPVSVLQGHYNLIYREAELELLPMVRHFGYGLMTFGPLAIGLLSGRFRHGQAPLPDSPWGKGYTGFDQLLTPQTDRVVEALAAIGREQDKTAGQVAVAWILSRGEVTTPIIGPSSPAEVEEYVGALDVELRSEDRTRLDELSAPGWATRP